MWEFLGGVIDVAFAYLDVRSWLDFLTGNRDRSSGGDRDIRVSRQARDNVLRRRSGE